MRVLANTIIAILLCALQTTFFAKVEIFGVNPNLLLAFVVCVALLWGNVEGGGIGLLCGILTDIMGYGNFGINAILFMYIGIAIGFLSKRIYRVGKVAISLFTLAITFTYGFIYYFFAFFIWGNGSMWFAISRKILPEALYTSAISVLILMLVKLVNKKIIVREA